MASLARDILRHSHVTDVFACEDCDWSFHCHYDPERRNGWPRSAGPNAARTHLRGNPLHVVKRHRVLHQTISRKGAE